MNNPDNFLDRWSRRKREAAEAAGESDPAPSPVQSRDAAFPDTPPKAQPAKPCVPAEPAFDPSILPPLESIGAETDIRAFLAPGVPAELTRAALRLAWRADPKIRNFVGLAENAWDFNAPGAMPGFGPLEMTDELLRLVTKSLGGIPDSLPPENLAGGEEERRPVGEGERSEPTPLDQPKSLQSREDLGRRQTAASIAEAAAAAHKGAGPGQETSVTKHTHGSALPK